MAYIGNKLADAYTSFAKQDFTTSATTSYTLDYPVANANEIALFINFVRQEPTTAYTASGTNLTLTSATSASDDMYCVFLGKAVQTVNPPAGSVGASQIADGSIALGKLSATGTKDSTTFLRGDNTFAEVGGGGKVLQVVYANTTTEKVVSSATFVDTGLAATITPSATTSKILVICEISSIGKANNNTAVHLKLLRDSTDLIVFLKEGGYTNDGSINKIGNSGCTYLDSPSTTSATTYKVQMNSDSGSSYGQTGGSGGVSTMTLMEISE